MRSSGRTQSSLIRHALSRSLLARARDDLVLLAEMVVSCSSGSIRSHRFFEIGARVPEISERLLILGRCLGHVGLLGLQIPEQRRFLLILLENHLQFLLFCILRECSDVQTGAGFAQFAETIAYIEHNLTGSFGKIELALLYLALLFVGEMLLVAPVIDIPLELYAQRIHVARQTVGD